MPRLGPAEGRVLFCGKDDKIENRYFNEGVLYMPRVQQLDQERLSQGIWTLRQMFAMDAIKENGKPSGLPADWRNRRIGTSATGISRTRFL